MKKKFIMNESSWDYANLAKSAAKYGGPQKFMKAIYNDGRASRISNERFLGVAVGVIVVAIPLGIAMYTGNLKWISSKDKG